MDRDRADIDIAGLGGILVLLLGALALTMLVLVDREQNEFAEVVLEALHVGVEALFAQVATAAIDADANRGSVLGGDSGSLDLFAREAVAKAALGVVAHSRAVDDGAEEAERAREALLGLQQAQTAAVLLALRLVQPDLDVALLRRAGVPVLALMDVGDCLIALHHCGLVLVLSCLSFVLCNERGRG